MLHGGVSIEILIKLDGVFTFGHSKKNDRPHKKIWPIDTSLSVDLESVLKIILWMTDQKQH